MVRILISSVGSLVGHNLLEALRPVRDQLFIIGTETNSAAANNFRCDAAYMVPDTSDDISFSRRLEKIIRDENVDLVVSGTDSDLPVLARLGVRNSIPNTVIVVPPPELVEVCNDKYETFLFAQELGLPFAQTASTPEELADLSSRYGYPLLGKVRRGSATDGVFAARNDTEARRALADGRFVLQPYLGDIAEIEHLLIQPTFGVSLSPRFRSVQYSTQFLIGREGTILGYIATEAHMVEGRSMNSSRIQDSRLDTVAWAYAEHMAQLGYRGPLNIQSKRLADGSYVPFELNARFTGQTDARALLGFNEALLAIEHFLDLEFEVAVPTLLEGPPPVSRILTSYTADLQDIEKLNVHGWWSKADTPTDPDSSAS